jgi:hypothetical protein
MISPFDSMVLPDQTLSDSQIIAKYGTLKNYYLRTAQHWGGYFYRPGTSQNNQYHGNAMISEYQEIVRNMELFQGRQRTYIFNFLDQLSQGGGVGDKASAMPIQPGQESASIFLFLQGVFISIVATAEPKAMVLNEDIKNKIAQKLKMVEIMRVFKDEMEQAQMLTGFKLDVPMDPSAPTDKVYRAISENVGTKILFRANTFMKQIQKESMSISDYARAYINALVGRRAVIMVDEQGFMKIVRPESYGYVSTDDDDMGKYDICRFYYDTIHIEEAARLYKPWLTDSEFKQLRTASFVDQPWFEQVSKRYPYQLYTPENNLVVRGTFFYKGTIDSGYVTKNRGEENAYTVEQRKGRKGAMVPCLKRVVTLANSFAVNYGVHETIEDPSRRGNTLFPLMAFHPNLFNGYNVSLADRLSTAQQNCDMAMNRMAENAALSLGTIISILGDTLTDGEGAAEVYAKLREYRIQIRTTSGIAGNPNDKIPGITKEDMSLMGDVEQYMKYYQQMHQIQKEIANVNDITMGTPTEYVGNKTQQGSIAQASNSYQYTMNGTIQLFSDAASYAIEMRRRQVIKDPTNPIFVNLLGEDGVQAILDDKENSFSTWLCSISVKDNLDPRRRAQILDFLMKNPNTKLRDVIEVQDAPTITAIKDYADYMDQRNFAIQQRAAAAEAAANAEKESIRAQGAVDGKMAQAEASRANTRDKILGDIAGKKMDQGAPDEEIAAMLEGNMQ